MNITFHQSRKVRLKRAGNGDVRVKSGEGLCGKEQQGMGTERDVGE